MKRVFIALGSNLASPVTQLESALQALARLPQTSLKKVSPFYQSAPLGPQDQPDYVNAVAELETDLAPLALLDALQNIEKEQGRVRLRRWGERTLDLDILLIDDEIFTLPRLTVPHYDMLNREFVIIPLFDIAPDLTLPNGEKLAFYAQQFALHKMKSLEKSHSYPI